MNKLYRPRSFSPSWPVPAPGPWPEAADRYHVIIIGAGIGGLSAGALLARRGFKVIVLEAHSLAGGYCSSWPRRVRRGGKFETFIFDAGVQDIGGLGPRGPIGNLLRQLGAEQAIEWKRVDHYYWQEGLGLDVPRSAAAFAGRLGGLFPEERKNIGDFFTEIEAVYRDMYADIEKTGGVPMPPADIESLLSWPESHPHAWRWMKRPFTEMLDAFFADTRLKNFLATLHEYITDSPENLSVGDMAPLFGYYFDGGFYPAGGSQRFADLLCRAIRGHGGQVLLNTKAERILIEGGRAAGVRTAKGITHFAPLIVANGDVASMMDLAGTGHFPARYVEHIGAMRRGPSAILASLGLDTVPGLPARIFIRHDGLEFGIGNPSVIDSSLAPPGHSVLTMLYLLPEPASENWRRGDKDYAAMKDMFADRMIAAAESAVLPGLRRHIVYREVASPPTFTRYTQARNGNIYGAAYGQWRPGVRSPVPGLMLVGAGTSTGAGIEAVVVSGTIAADLIAPPANVFSSLPDRA